MDVNNRKYALINKIVQTEDEKLLVFLEKCLADFPSTSQTQKDKLKQLASPLQERLDITEVKNQTNYKGADRERMNAIIEELDIQEPLEELLNCLNGQK
jgi:hypothetical protein